MAIVIIGKSKCPLCGKLFIQEDEIISLPAISDTTNPLWKFFDAGIHKSCYETWDKKEVVESILKKEGFK